LKVSLLAGALVNLGVVKGDRILIYMPLIPEAIISMLAVVRIGAVHSVVFGGKINYDNLILLKTIVLRLVLSITYADTFYGYEYIKIIKKLTYIVYT